MRTFQAVLAASLPVDSSGRAQLLPAGEFAARDGRPGTGRKWKLNDAAGVALAAALSATAAATPVVIDYDHQTLFVQHNGQPAPAAGWIKSAAWLSGQGLFADVEWTQAASARIAAKEYRYISPVITFDKHDNVTSVALAALCNFPALTGMEPVVAHLSTQFQPQERSAMNPTLTALLSALGLAATTTETEALSAVAALRNELTALKAKPTLPTALATELGLAAGADETAVLTAVRGLKTAGGGNQAMMDLVTRLQGEVSELSTRLNGDKVTQLVDGAIATHKLTAGVREQYIALGQKDFAMLSTLLEKAPVIPGLGGQSKDVVDPNATGTAALTGSQQKIATALGISHEAYAKQLKAEAGTA